MQSCMIVVVLALVLCAFSGVNTFPPLFSEDVLMFLPFLRHYQPPPPCPTNELYMTCTGKCSDCIQRGKCTVTTCRSACDCAPRFYRVKPGGPCEPVANCPKPECGENEVFRECGPTCERCTTLRCTFIHCDHKCYCKEGYLRNSEGVCVPEKDCPARKKCTGHEEWADSGPVDEFCMNFQNGTLKNETQEVSKCYCKSGFKRSTLGNCIPENACQHSMRCYGNETFHSCAPKCNTTCRNYGNSECEEDGNCYAGCFCVPGYVMNDFRKCILPEECSLEIAQVKVIIPTEMEEDEEYSNQTTSTTKYFANRTITTDMDDSTESPYNNTQMPETPDSGTTEINLQTTTYESTGDETTQLQQSTSATQSAANGTSEVGYPEALAESGTEETSVTGQSEDKGSQAVSESKTNGTSGGVQSQSSAESEASGTAGDGKSQSSAQSEASKTSGDGKSQSSAQSEASETSGDGKSQSSAQSDSSGISAVFVQSEANGSSAVGQLQSFAQSEASGISGVGQSQSFAQSLSRMPGFGQTKAFAKSGVDKTSGYETSQILSQDKTGETESKVNGNSKNEKSEAFTQAKADINI